ncbi:hypothetical protein JY651_41830 [Pyxidicoccus parkwayensis]|uniref:Uncharacterized protein n=1 Tax=Pyxidicoccus parkwayensis TaxID=2813578 RepID=A0ABX7NRY9_9BACT|nr:hypothetical protein [Pyxidicoccus parkwaysis]QSQ21644.1 hypothetical protein JY651_41830 [Pyxidicoccus parkwaysis]
MTTRIPTKIAAPAVRGPFTQTVTKPTIEPVKPNLPDARRGIVAGGCFPPDHGHFPHKPHPLPHPGGHLPHLPHKPHPLPFPQHPAPFPFPKPQPQPFPFPGGGHCGTPVPTKPGGGCWTPLDLSAMVELGKLDQTKGPVTGEQMADAIQNGTADLDGQAASGEYRAFAEWAQKNAGRLTPEAKQVMDIYSKYAAQAQARGETGISQADSQKMQAEMAKVGDQGAKRALSKLDKLPSPISGRDMARAIESGVKDKDNNTQAEVDAFRDWAKKNGSKLSPEAKDVLAAFEKHAGKAMAHGDKDLSRREWADLKKEFRHINSSDASARHALEKLDKEHGSISGEDMLDAIKEGVSDTDGHSTTSELREFQNWARKNKDRLTPEAKQVLETYEKFAKKAGPEGLSQGQFDQMTKEMGKFKTFHDDSMRNALETLDVKNGRISAKDLTAAIKTGAGDLDGQAAGVEFADLQKWARDNYSRLGPDARKVLDIYEKYATRSMSSGSTGIANNDFQRMLREMNRVSEPVFRPTHIVA